MRSSGSRWRVAAALRMTQYGELEDLWRRGLKMLLVRSLVGVGAVFLHVRQAAMQASRGSPRRYFEWSLAAVRNRRIPRV